jgi:hypothetical protein
MKESTRAYIYRILLGASPLVVFYGIASADEVALWIALGANILGISLAVANTSTHND